MELNIRENADDYHAVGECNTFKNKKYSSLYELINNAIINERISKYDKVSKFVNGLALVQLNNKYGYINKKGKEIISCKYDLANDFDEKISRVRIKDKIGYINIKGKILIPIKYENAFNLHNGIIAVRLYHNWGAYDIEGHMIVPTIYKSLKCIHKLAKSYL